MRAVFASLLTKDRINQLLPLTILAFKNDKPHYQSRIRAKASPLTSRTTSSLASRTFQEEPGI